MEPHHLYIKLNASFYKASINNRFDNYPCSVLYSRHANIRMFSVSVPRWRPGEMSFISAHYIYIEKT